MILVQIVPSNQIEVDEQLVIEIPTVSMDGIRLFTGNLGMGYKDYDNLIFDLYESSTFTMNCKVFTGDPTINQPVKIICSGFNSIVTTSSTIKFGFWVVNPSTTVGLAIPV
jgi:hypothetical protein